MSKTEATPESSKPSDQTRKNDSKTHADPQRLFAEGYGSAPGSKGSDTNQFLPSLAIHGEEPGQRDYGAPKVPETPKDGGPEASATALTITRDADGKPTAYHSNGFSFEYHKDNDTWYYHQDSGGDYVKIDIPTVNDNGTVSTHESGGFNAGRTHELSGNGQTTEDWLDLKKNDPLIAGIWHGLPGKLAGDIIRSDVQVGNDLLHGNFLDAATGLVKRDLNEFNDLLTAAKGKNPVSAWDWGQRLEADLATSGEGSEQFKKDLDWLNELWDGHSYGGTTRGDLSRYYDDNAWIGIAMVDAYKQNPNNPEYLDRAKKLFDYVSSAAEGTENLPHPGGLFWQQGEDVRTAVSTAGGTQLALELYQQTHDQKYLDFAKKQYNWMNDTLKNKDGLFLDGINANGSNDNHETLFSYNQGLMLGNATMLYQITGDKNYLDQANQIAKGTIDWRFNEQEPFFNAVYFKNLMLLDSVQPNNEYRQALSKYAGELQNTLNGGNIDKWHDHELTQAAARQIFALAEQNPPT